MLRFVPGSGFAIITLFTLLGVSVPSVLAQDSSSTNSGPPISTQTAPAKANQPPGSIATAGQGENAGKPAAKDSKPSEDISTPRIPDASLLPVPEVTRLGEAKYPGFTREFLQAQWRGTDPIDLWVIKPEGIKNPPVILYLYSFPSDTNRFENLDFERFLTKNGFAAVGFVSALTGQRYHDLPMRQWFISELQMSLAYTAHDVQLILNYLSSRGDLDMTRVGMFGDGSGASIAILAAAVDPRIKVLDLLDPWGDWPDWLAKSTLVPEDERPNYLKPEFLAKVENLDPVKWLPELKTPQVRLQYIDRVRVTPDIAKQRILAAAGSNVKVVHYENTKTFLAEVGSTGKAFDWMKEQLGSTTAEQVHGAKDKPIGSQEAKKANR